MQRGPGTLKPPDSYTPSAAFAWPPGAGLPAANALYRKRLFRCLALTCSLATFAQDTTGAGAISGVVLNSSGHPLGGISVCVAELSRCVVTSVDGRFTLSDLRAQRYVLRIEQSAKLMLEAELFVRAGGETITELTLPNLDGGRQSVTVSDSLLVAPAEVKNSSFVVPGSQVFKSAGALQDVSRYVQTLPGVAIGSDDFRNDLIVRGGSPLENLFVVDNVEVPNINSFANFTSAGGTVSILDAALLQDVTFLTGGYPAPYVNRTSSVLQVAQREGDRERLRGRATLGFAGAGTILEGPIKRDRGSWIVSARRTFLDLFTNDVGFGGVPVAYTFNAKGVYDLTPRDRFWLVGLSGVDRIRLGAREGAENDDEVNTFDIRYQGWRAASGFNWQRLFGDRGVGLLGLTYSAAKVDQAVKDLYKNGVPDPSVPIGAVIESAPVIYQEDSKEQEITTKYDFTAYIPYLEKLQAGGHFKVFRNGYRIDSPFGTDTPWSQIPGIDPFSLRKELTAFQTGAYIQSTKRVTQKFSATFGGRFDNYEYIGRSRFSARAGVSYQLTPTVSWRASYGNYFQQPFFQFIVAFPENLGVIPFRANHYVTGLSYTRGNTLRLTLEAYQKDYKDYPVARQIPSLSLASIGDTFNVQQILFPLTSAGRGRVRGVELSMEKRFTQRWFGQANFSYSRTRQAALDGIKRPGSFDYTFIANLVGGYRLNRKWEVATRFAYLSGRPYTPFDVPLSTQQRRGIYDLDRINADRLPPYIRFDIRADRAFTFREQVLLLFVGAQNVINRKNIAGYQWSRVTNSTDFNEQLGIFPLFGLEWRF